MDNTIIFGPVPSRRLGHSLGINNIPPKTCSYSCIYCQLGRTAKMQIERREFYSPSEVARCVLEKVNAVRESGGSLDYITFVADGEPTLDSNLGREIDLIRASGVKVAVITNASLIWREEVKRDLMKADWVSVKVDAITPGIWHTIDRPLGTLDLDAILKGVLEFSGVFTGELATETMLIEGVNTSAEEIACLTEYLSKVNPGKAYLSIPTRPPAEATAKAAGEHSINAAYQQFSEKLRHVECLLGYEGNDFASTGDVQADLLSITAVHPMREDAVRQLLEQKDTSWKLVEQMMDAGLIREALYQGRKFYIRTLPATDNGR